MIIGLCGLKGSGKDTVAARLIKDYGFERKAFADSLKRSAAALLDIDASEFEKLKNDSNAFVGLYSYTDNPHFRIKMSVREYLQRYGTEAHRQVFGWDFWVDQVLPMDGFYAERNIVVTDVRYINEADRIHALQGHVIRVMRARPPADMHSSEQEQLLIQADYELDNTTMLTDLPQRIDKMMFDLARKEHAI
jgi:Deoxynucleotide monophosphate kinase